MDPTTLDGFITLFRGRGDCYGSWEGRCVREPLNKAVFEGHLIGETPIGVYPAIPLGTRTQCVWGCTDIDKTDDISKALAIFQALEVQGMMPWLERTAHGWHVWIFCSELVEAVHMRNMFLAAHQVAEVPATEVNPKQSHLSVGQVGNYVRLPYPHVLGGSIARKMLLVPTAWPESQIWRPLDEFVRDAVLWRDSRRNIERLAAYYKPPPPPRQIIATPTQDMEEAARRLTPLGRILFRDGPLEHGDRSLTLLRLVYECHTAGLAPEDCLVLLEDADLRWGKFMARGEKGEQELSKLITKVYGGTLS